MKGSTMFSAAAGCSSSSASSNQQPDRQRPSTAGSSSSSSSSSSASSSSSTTNSSQIKFNLNEAINSFPFVGRVVEDFSHNIKDSIDGITKNLPDMHKFFNHMTTSKTSCNSCDTNLTMFSRKKCGECSLTFCVECMVEQKIRMAHSEPRKSICNRCLVFNRLPYNRDGLNSLKVRDLKWFLAMRNVPSHYYFEKSELIDLVIAISNRTGNYSSGYSTSNPSATSGSQPEQQQQQQQQVPRPGTTSANRSQTFAETRSEQQQQTSNNAEPNNRNQNESSSSSASSSKTSSINISLDEIKQENEIKELPVKQLKILLTRNFVDFKGCIERDELVAKVILLYRDKKQNDAIQDEIESDDRNNATSNGGGGGIGVDENQCKICWDKVVDCVFLDCGHMCTCTDCGKQLRECPMCRQFIARVVHVFKS